VQWWHDRRVRAGSGGGTCEHAVLRLGRNQFRLDALLDVGLEVLLLLLVAHEQDGDVEVLHALLAGQQLLE
jgi:hypothetical protein